MSLDNTLADLAGQSQLGEQDRSLLWAAFHGEEELQRAMAGEQIDPPPATSAASTAPVWLSSVAVEGFRGIGPRTELLLNPKPGLTLVVGRNGSGKSSFAEGLEALLTGDNLRWRDRPAAWQSGWKNLHHTDETSIQGEFQQEGQTATTNISRQFDKSFEDSTLTCDRDGDPVDFDTLGWDDPLANFKPFLSYNELGSMLEQKPSAIYDSMAGVLGIERLTDARNRLRQARLNAEKPAKELAKSKKALLDILATAAANADQNDSRPADATELLGARRPDLQKLEALAFGEDRSSGGDALTAIAQLSLLENEQYADIASALRNAGAEYQRLATTDAATSDRVAGLLRQALEHHGHEGDGPCPVCGQGTLDPQWRAKAEQEAAVFEGAATAMKGAEQALAEARRAALDALLPVPAALEVQLQTESSDPSDAGTSAVAELGRTLPAVQQRWTEWTTPPASGWTDEIICARLADVEDINGVIEGVRSVASEAAAAHDAGWRPAAQSLIAWIEESRQAEVASQVAKRVGAVEDLYKQAEAKVRTERFQPIADRSAKLWEGLRQQSNVNLERVSLEGQTTQRRVDLDVTVDGSATSALGVMSQGELHALALALFLPRVTAPESPFRFLLVDDPVQAMDPARVDGLARVLNEVAQDRQVIVFTHDDRLPSACRRLDLSADIIEITRQSESRVSASLAEHPAEKAIGDAYALAKTERLPPWLKRQIVPIHCRRAVESQVQDLAWRRLLRDGKTHDEIEQMLDEADTSVSLLSLLLFGQDRSPTEVYERVDRLLPGSASQLKFLNRAVHDAPDDLKPETLTGTIRKLLTALKEMPLPT